MHADLHVTAIQETKLSPEASLQTHMHHISVRQPVTYSIDDRAVPSGVITLLLSNVPKHRVVLQLTDPHFEAIGVANEEITYVAIYIRKHITKEDLQNYFNHIHMTCRGRTVLFGDFNAKHHDWGAEVNNPGTWLRN